MKHQTLDTQKKMIIDIIEGEKIRTIHGLDPKEAERWKGIVNYILDKIIIVIKHQTAHSADAHQEVEHFVKQQ